MRLLCGSELSEDDLDYILNASEVAEKISDNFLKDVNNIYDEYHINHLKLLAWMVDKGILEIKIGIVKNEEGYVGGILHEKTGILIDKDGESIVFSGSNNETKKGWSSEGFGNIEKFKVFNSWEDSKFIYDDADNFEEDWNNRNPYLEVMDVPKAAKEGLVKLAPKSLTDVMKLPLSFFEESVNEDERKLRDYQEEAIQSWLDHDKRGIFKMATGTGKTFTALNCLSNCLDESNELVTIIACPYTHLVDQWAIDVEKNFDLKIFRLYGAGNYNWKKDLSNLVFKFDLGILNNCIILTTHDSFSKDFFKEQISKLSVNKLLIVDEMHHVASKGHATALLDVYNYRLGLSATPEIYNDDDKTDLLMDYFGGIIFKFGIEDALNEFDEDFNTYLAPYDYKPIRVNLNPYELRDYKDLTKQIQILKDSNKKKDMELVKTLKISRKNIINNAEEKYSKLVQILRDYDNLDHLIVFCSPQQMQKVLKILKDEGVSPRHKFTYNESTVKSKDYGGLSEREFLVQKFDEGFYKALVAIKCLDEGVDIPSASKVIIMSSSNNPREYVQRRGRVLRRFEGKEKATIYDMAVIPTDGSGILMKNIIKNEKNRLFDFIGVSDNPGYCMNLLEKWGII